MSQHNTVALKFGTVAFYFGRGKTEVITCKIGVGRKIYAFTFPLETFAFPQESSPKANFGFAHKNTEI